METKILDCTIRDGGHLNNWNFDEDFVKSAYDTASASGIDFFETGYRNKISAKNSGKFMRCEDDFLFSFLNLNEKCKLGVMADTGKSGLEDFKDCKENLTPVKFVRVSTYPDKIFEAFELCKGLADKGYEVFLNLMAISKYSEKNYEILQNFGQKNCIKSLYFSDSFGALFPSDIEKIYKNLIAAGFEKISFHAHNNLQLAFANTLKAVELNFYSTDVTISGLGRGAGNLPVELFLGYLNQQEKEKYTPVFYMNFIEKYIKNFKKNEDLGFTIPHLISGLKNIHPNYTDKMKKENFSCEKIWQTSEKIKEKNVIKYDENLCL